VIGNLKAIHATISGAIGDYRASPACTDSRNCEDNNGLWRFLLKTDRNMYGLYGISGTFALCGEFAK
jgi:hypothetical protein